MNKKTTLFSLKCFLVLVMSQGINAQQIYTNGPLSTGAASASAVTAPIGYTWSEVQSDTGNTTESNTNFGFGAIFNNANTGNIQLADNFVVPAGQQFNTTSFDFFCYQTGYTGTAIPIDQLRIQVYSSDPSVTGAVSVGGDMVTNVLDATNSADALMYRTGNSVTPAPGTVPGTTRKIWRVRGNLALTLAPGTYWVVYQAHATNDLNIFFPPVTVQGSRGLAGWNSKQNTVVGATPGWVSVLDTGNPAAAPDVPQDMPFFINGTILSVDQNDFEARITLSPNPVKNIISIEKPTDVVISSYEIYDINGKVVKSINASDATNISDINVSELSIGNYILKLKSDKGLASKKFIKE